MRRPVPLLQALQSLPELDQSGLYPLAFISLFRECYQRYYDSAHARKLLVANIELKRVDQTDAVTFILALSACLAWRTSKARRANEKDLGNLIKRCQRRAKQKHLPSYANVQRLKLLRLYFRPQSIAKWQAYITWGFACAHQPDGPTWRVLETFEKAIAMHVYNMPPKRRQERREQVKKFTNSIRANIFRFRGQGEREMSDRSTKHFDALRRQLTHRGIVPSNMRVGNW